MVLCPTQCPVCGDGGYPPTACDYWIREVGVDWYIPDAVTWMRYDEVLAIYRNDPNRLPFACDAGVPLPVNATVNLSGPCGDPEGFECSGGRDYWFFCSACENWVRVLYTKDYCELVLERLCTKVYDGQELPCPQFRQ